MPRAHQKEFRHEVVAVARRREALIAHTAENFAITESSRRHWLHAADVEDGNRPRTTVSRSAEVRELRRRNRLLEQEVEV